MDIIKEPEGLGQVEMYDVTERLYLDAEGNIVAEDSPEAASLYSTPGMQVPLEEAIEKGLTNRKPGSGPTVDDLKAKLDHLDVSYKSDAKKADLEELLKEAEVNAAAETPTPREVNPDAANKGDETSGAKKKAPARNKQRKPAANKGA